MKAEAVLASVKPLVSVVMASWNRAAAIQVSIRSVLAQRYQNFELIISDDGSSDDTVSLIRHRFAAEIAGGRIKLLCNPHRGVSAARNAGLEAAQGEIIAYLDSDNIW